MTTENNKRLYVSNLDFSVTPIELKELFEKIGPVIFYTITLNREDGRSRGFGFVEMENVEDAVMAIKELNNTEYRGRIMLVDFTRENRVTKHTCLLYTSPSPRD